MSKKLHKGKEHRDFILKPDLSITFKGKQSLKRSEETGIPLEDEAVIAVMEGDAPGEVQNTELAALYAGTRLQPDKSITFPHAASLKKSPAIIPVYARYAAAAVILLFFSIGAWFIFQPSSTIESNKYELAKLEMIERQLPTAEAIKIDPISRETGQIQVSIRVRESIEIGTMSSLAYTPMDHRTNTSSMDIGIHYRSYNFQDPTDVPSEFEGSSIDYAAAEPKQKGLLGRVFSGLFKRVSAPFEGAEKETEKSSGDGFLWNVAQLGVKSLNVLGDHDYTLVRDYNEKGNVKGVIVLDE